LRPDKSFIPEELVLEPDDVIAGNGVDVCVDLHCSKSLRSSADNLRNSKSVQMFPLGDFGGPDALCDEPGSHHEYASNVKSLEKSLEHGE
jgi:hypothetical protein